MVEANAALRGQWFSFLPPNTHPNMQSFQNKLGTWNHRQGLWAGIFANAMVDVAASPCVFKCSQWPWWMRWCEGAAPARVFPATHETWRLFCRCPSVQSQSPSAWELLFLFTNTLVTSVETIRLLNPEPAIGCASAAIIGRFVAITHRKQSLADLMTVFGCRDGDGWRRLVTARG